MYSKRRQPRKQTKSRSGRRKTQRGGRFINVSDAVSTVRADLQTRQELPSRVDGLQATVDELQKQVADLKDNTATANDVATLQKRLDAI
jgi:polyhydroxyalkanoate synthesis regulator phasin